MNFTGSMPMVFFICSGETPTKNESSSLQLKCAQALALFVMLLNIFLSAKTLKKKFSTTETPVRPFGSNFRHAASNYQNLSDLATVIVTTTTFFVTVIFMSYLNNVDPESLNFFPNKAFLIVFRMFWPSIIGYIIFLTLFFKNSNLRGLWKEFLGKIFCTKLFQH